MAERKVLVGKKREMGSEGNGRGPETWVGAWLDQRSLCRVTFMGPATRQGRLSHVRRRPGDRIDLPFDLESL
jgi:hypothetical protein